MEPKPAKLITVLALLHIVAFTKSEDPYKCCKYGMTDDGRHLWDCRRCLLRSIPPNPPANVTAVSLEANEIQEIPRGSFQNYGNVVWLHLGNNSLTLEKGKAHFDDMPQLTQLFLPRNPIILSHLSDNNSDVFQALGNLTKINLYRVECNKIDDKHFVEYPGRFLAPLKSLKVAVLPAVSFEQFGSYFKNLKRLHILSLLSSMPGAKVLWTDMKKDTFKYLPQLTRLTFMDSSLRTIEPNAFKPLENLQEIEVFCSDLQAIDIINAIEHLPKPSLETLVFEYDRSLADIPKKKTFSSLKNLRQVIMGIPFMVPHPNPFMLDFLPIFWESVTDLEIIQPFSDVYVSTVYRNPDQPNRPLKITVSNTIRDVPYRSACIMTSIITKVNTTESDKCDGAPNTTVRAQYSDSLTSKYGLARAAKPKSQSGNGMERSTRKTNLLQSSTIHKAFEAKPNDTVMDYSTSQNPNISSFGAIADHKFTKPQLTKTENFLHPGCYSGQFSPQICFRLLSLTLTFYMNYAQSQVLDLVIQQAEQLGIHAELVNLTVNHFLYNKLPGDSILKNLEELKFPEAHVTQLGSRNMSKLQIYDISFNSIKDLCNTHALSRLHRLRMFNASNNQLMCIDESSFSFASNLSILDLSYNNFKSISLNISQLNKLKFINLTKNQIENLPESFMEQIANHPHLQIDLTNNSLACTCGLQNISFIKLMLQHKAAFKDFDNYKCLDMKGNPRLIKDINIIAHKAECTIRLILYVTIPLACSLVLIIVITLSYQQRWRIMWYAYLLTSNMSRPRRRQQNDPEAVPLIDDVEQECHDVFLSYAQEDIDIKTPVLEKLLSLGLSVMHPEIFEWGVSMFQETVDRMQNSKKIVFLVTREFVRCNFCNFQLQMAYVKGRENIFLLQMDSLAELSNAGMQPLLRQLLQGDDTYEYAYNDYFWNTLHGRLKS